MLSIKRIISGIFQEEKKPALSLRDVAGKIAVFIAIVVCIGFPITDIFHFAVLFLAGLVVAGGTIRLSARRFAIVFAVVLIVVLMKGLLPRAALEEGHNVFVTKEQGEPLEQGLPPEVFAYTKELFLKQYPPEKRCDPQHGTCWQAFAPPQTTFEFSADSVWRKAKYSRVVDSINFDNLSQFRGGFTNDFAYNWYLTSDVKRESMPYFVMYELSPSSVNSSLCWRGHVLWETSPDRFTAIYHSTQGCRKITSEDVGKRVFGVSINNSSQLGFRARLEAWKLKLRQFLHGEKDDSQDEGFEQLAMRLRFSPILKVAGIINNFLLIGGIFTIILLMFKIRWQNLILPIIIILAASALVSVYCPHLFGEYYIHEGGEDGLTHQTFGRRILIHAMNGDWREALRGEQDVYWDTPGFRYFRAIEKSIFGDTNFGYLLVALVFAYLWYLFLTHFVPKAWAFWITLIFIWGLFPLRPCEFFGDFGFAYYLYVMIVRGGWPDTLGFAAFLTALWLLIKYWRLSGKTYLWFGFIAHFLLFVAVFMRPNFSVVSLVVILYFACRLAREKRFKEIVFTWAGFAPVLLIPLHNYWFGKKFCLFTGAIDMAVTMPPSVYLQAFKELVTSNFKGANIEQVLSHLKTMLGPWYRWVALMTVFFAAFTKRNLNSNLRLLAIAVLSLHFVNLFIFAVFWRYVFLTWALTAIVALSLIWSSAGFIAQRIKSIGLGTFKLLKRQAR